MKEVQKMTGIQKLITGVLCVTCREVIHGYCSLADEKKEELHKKTAILMLNKAVRAELKEPYEDFEIEYIKEHIGI